MTTIKKFVIAALLIVSMPVASVFGADPDEQLHKKCLYPTVMVRNTRKSAGGTGFIVRSEKVGKEWHNVVLTCAHNCYEGETYQVWVSEYEDWSTFKQYTKYPCHVYAFDRTKDTALLLFTTKDVMPTVDLDFSSKYYMGTEIFKIGHGALDEARLDYGKVTAPKTKINDQMAIRTSAFTTFGDSGGPLFLNYKVIGMMNLIRGTPNGYQYSMSYAVPMSRFKSWSEAENNNLDFLYTSKETPRRPFIQMRVLAEEAAAEADAKKTKK